MPGDLRDNPFVQCARIARILRHRFIESIEDYDTKCAFKSLLLQSDGLNGSF